MNSTVTTKDELADRARKHLPTEAPDPPENPILKSRAWRKMWLEDSNALWVIVGDTGDGKSLASVRLGEKIDPNFSVEDNVAKNIVDFIRMATDKDNYGQGSVIVLEEASVEASSLDWHNKSNRIFAKILDTWRHQNRMGIINLPNFMALDKGARRRTKAIIKMQFAKPWLDYSQGKFYDSQYENVEDNFTTPFPIIDGRKRKYIRFKLPSQDLVDAYEAQKTDYTDELNERLLSELLEEQEDAQDDMGPKDIAGEIVSENRVDQYISSNNGQQYLDRGLIELDYEIGERTGKKVKKAIQQQIDNEELL